VPDVSVPPEVALCADVSVSEEIVVVCVVSVVIVAVSVATVSVTTVSVDSASCFLQPTAPTRRSAAQRNTRNFFIFCYLPDFSDLLRRNLGHQVKSSCFAGSHPFAWRSCNYRT
jgi:hypothetical protein